MSLNFAELKTCMAALAPLQGSLLQGVYQPTRENLILELYQPGLTCTLSLHFRGPFTRITRINKRPPNPKKAFAFQQLARKTLKGVLTSLFLHPNNRIFELVFESRGQKRRLVAEMMGPKGNLYLLDHEGLILGAALSAGPKRRLQAGAPYAAPEGQAPEGSDRWAPREGDAWLDAMSQDLTERALAHHFHSEKSHIESQLKQSLKRSKRLAKNLEKDMNKASEAGNFRKYGDLLQINLKDLKRGLPQITVTDLFSADQSPIDIPLRPKWNGQENIAHYYHQFRRLSRAEDQIMERAADTEEKIFALEAQLKTLSTIMDIDGLRAQFPDIRPRKRQSRNAKRKKEAQRLPYWVYRSRNGTAIRVGKNSRDNDLLTFRHSRGNDIWFHVRNRPGSHVIIPGKKGYAPPLDVMIDAAVLALKYSRLPEGEQAEVAYTQVKYVKKPKGAAPGMVIYTQDKSLNTKLDPEIMAQLQKEEGA